MTNSVEAYGLAHLMGQSTVGKLDYVAAILSDGECGIGYDAVSGWMLSHPGKVCPVDYVVLLAEAALADLLIEHVEQSHPKARQLSQYLVSHMNQSHREIMAKLPFQFNVR